MSTNKKILSIVVLILLAVSAISISIFFYNFKSYTIKTTTDHAISIAQNVRDGLTAHMVNGTMDKKNFFLSNIARHQKVENFHLLRAPSVVQQYGNENGSNIQATKLEQRVLNTKEVHTVLNETFEKSVLQISIPYIATSNDTPNCMQCHTTQEGDVLGVISMDIDISQTQTEAILIILKILAIVILVLIASIFVINYSIKPYIKLFDDLEDGISQIYRGDFSYHVDTTLNNEAGKVADRLNELSEIYKFKKTIELDENKMEIYQRIIHILQTKFNVENYILFEINNKTKMREVISSNVKYDTTNLTTDAHNCRAFRTSSYINSNDFANLCDYCEQKCSEYICFDYIIDDDYSIILHIQSNTKKQMDAIKKYVPVINNYFEMAKPVIESKILMAILKDSILKDPMTSLYNRRFLDELLESSIQERVQENHCHAFLMIDIDFFKKVNDTYGHDVGDTVIKKLAIIMKNTVRESDMPVRYGGEEFIIMLLNSTEEKTLEIAQNISNEFKKIEFTANLEKFTKTISIGISYYPTHSNDMWNTIKHADEALYIAKNTGRDKIVTFEKNMLDNH
jgi:diguanylate cyclase (GGDEF)-like protein